MKRKILIRSLRVMLVLLFLSLSIKLTIFDSGWCAFLILACLLLMDCTDSMLEYQLWRIEDPRIGRPFRYIYLISIGVAILWGIIALAFVDKTKEINPYTFMWILFAELSMAFSIKYFVIVLRIIYGLDKNSKNTSG